MKKYSILVVGINCYYGHVREFIINLKKKNPLVDVTLVISSLPDDVKTELLGYVSHIVIHQTYRSKIIPQFVVWRINIILYYWKFLLLHFRNHFDIVDIHFAKNHIKHVMPIFKRMTNNIVITPWGSDVMRVENEKIIKDMCEIYSQARYITVSSDSQIGQCAIKKFKVNPDKMVQLAWGGEFFDYIQENIEKVTTEDAKQRFGLNGRYVITCGYNTQKEQRHEEIINAIYRVKEQLPENLTLLFPFTYGRMTIDRKDYMKSIVDKSKILGFDICVIEKHLDMADLLLLRMATDIFVHVQTTDAGSRCVMEYVSCNKKVVHGAWIRYSYLEDYKPSCYFPVDKIENLGAVIVKAYNSQVRELPQEVRKIILERGWNHKMSQWNTFFESLVD